MPDQVIKIVIDADASKAIAQVQALSKELTGLSNSSGKASVGTVASGVAIGNMLSDLAEKALSMAKDFVNSFADTAMSVYQLQLAMGGTAEDMSKLKFMGDVVGVSTDQMTRAFMFASTHIAKQDAAAKRLGVAYKDLQGNIKTAPQLFMEMADKINSIRDPFLRAAAAKDIFGRGVLGILPLLGLGSKGMQKLQGDAEKLGVVLGNDSVNQARNYKAGMAEAKAAVTGLAIELGKNLLPALSQVLRWFTNGVTWVKNFFKDWDHHSGLVKALTIGIGILIVALGAAAVAFTVAGTAVAVFEAISSPVILIIAGVIAAIVGLGLGLIALVKNFPIAGEIVVGFSETLGNILGKAIWFVAEGFAGAIRVIKMFLDVVLTGAKYVGKVLDFFGLGDNIEGDAEAAKKSLDGALSGLIDSVGSFANKAWDGGSRVGKSIGEGLVNGIKNLHMPKMNEILPPTDPNQGPGADNFQYDPTGGGGGGAKKDFWKTLVDNARKALDALREAAIKARADMKKMADDMAKSMSEAFNVTDITKKSFARYLGVNVMMREARKKLADIKEFAEDVRKLAKMGLPHEMLVQLANAGFTEGLDTARLLVSNPQAIGDLQTMQNEINSVTTAAGSTIATAVMGPQVKAAGDAAAAGQRTFRQIVGVAQQHGYQLTPADIAAMKANVYNEVTINVSSMASAADIANAAAYGIKSGTTVGAGQMLPAYMGNRTKATPVGKSGRKFGAMTGEAGRTDASVHNSMAGESARGGSASSLTTSGMTSGR